MCNFLYQIFEGYLDDERNTDNAWLEVVVYNYYDDQNVVNKYLLSVSFFLLFIARN